MKTKLLVLSLFLTLSAVGQIPEIAWQQCHQLFDVRDNTRCLSQTENGYLVALEVYGPQWLPDIHGNFDIYVYNIDTSGNTVWGKCFGGSNIDKPKKIIKAANDEYFLFGSTNSVDYDVQSEGHGLVDLWVVKINQSGDILWEKTYGGPGMDDPKDIYLLPDGGFVMASTIRMSGGDITNYNGEDDLWIIRCDDQGNIIWEKTIGDEGDDEGNGLSLNNNGNIIIAGSSGNLPGNAKEPKEFWDELKIIELDLQGNILMERIYGGSSQDIGYKIEDINDGYIIMASTASDDGDVTGYHSYGTDIWIIRTDYLGDIIWQNCLGGYKANSFPIRITQTETGDFVIIGNTMAWDGDVAGNHTKPNGSANDVWIVKLSPQGSIEWQHCYGGVNDDKLMDMNTVVKKSDYNYVLAAQSTSENSFDVNCGFTGKNTWLIEIDRCPDYFPGTPDIPFGSDTLCSTTNHESVFTIEPPLNSWTFEWKLEPDSAGIISNNGLQASVYWSDLFVGTAMLSVRSENYCAKSQWSQPHYTEVFTCLGTEELYADAIKLNVYPNPANNVVNFEMFGNKESAKQSHTITITNIYGQQIAQLQIKDNKTIWDTRSFNSGVYFYSLMIGGEFKSGKLIVQH